jgi:hypothetical protein
MAGVSGNREATPFFVVGGTLRADAPCYVERAADGELLRGLTQGEFCYVLTSRQMGKSSLMVRTAQRLRERGVQAAVIDLTAIGQNLTPEQWYDGLLVRLGQLLRLEDELEAGWQAQHRLSPVQRFMTALRNVALGRRPEPLVLFVDEIDVVRSLPFATDEFFAAIRECYHRRSEDPVFNRLTFCLLGVATPADLIRNPRTTPFQIGQRVELSDFTADEAAPFAQHLDLKPESAQPLLRRILYWTSGHPYLTQRLCRALAEAGPRASRKSVAEIVDSVTRELFFGSRSREQDDNLLFVRERILRSEADVGLLLEVYRSVHSGDPVADDENNDLIHQLRLAGIVRVVDGRLQVRNRIYERVFDQRWANESAPDAFLDRADGPRLRLGRSCTIGRAPGCDLVLADAKVSRRHALIQAQKQHEFWLIDLGSSNGTFLNGRRVNQPSLLRDQDLVELGPFRLVFRQLRSGPIDEGERTVC